MDGLQKKPGKNLKNSIKDLISNGYEEIRELATNAAYYPVVNPRFRSLSSRLGYLGVMVRSQNPESPI
jgi:hypothetical protein